jgi:Trypsin-like peptidase domain
MDIAVDQLYFTVSKVITLYKGGDNENTLRYATGFFYSNQKNKLFFITNKHVIIEEAKKYFPNYLRFTLHTNPEDLKQNKDCDIALYDGRNKLWQESNLTGADVIAIPFDSEYIIQGNFIIRSFNSVNLVPSSIVLQIGEDVLIMGYPLGKYYDEVYNLPVVRNGIVATAYPVPYKNNPYFLVEARLHKGTSGAPIITKFKNVWRGVNGKPIPNGFAFYLLGINSSTYTLPYEEEPLGLNSAIYASIIEDITK